MQTVLLAGGFDMITIPTLVWAIYIGIVIGLFMTYYNKVILGKAIRAIIEKKAFAEENAMTAEELGFAKNRFILFSIRRGVLGRFIYSVSASEGEPLRYYMKNEDAIRAELRYSQKGTDLYFLVIALVVFLVLAFLAARFLPELLDMAKDLMS